MPDLTNELDSLLATFAEADRPALRDALTRNPAAVSHLTSRETVYSAFVDGDQTRMAAAAAAAAPPAATPAAVTPPAAAAPPATAPSGLTVEQVNALVAEGVRKVYTSTEFQTAVDARAEEKAKAQLAAERTTIIGLGANIADDIYTIRATHFREFNEELDRPKFEEYFKTEGPKHGNRLIDTYNAFVSERRIEKRIADGVQAGLAAAATAAVPGSSLPTANNPMAPNFIDHNVKVQKIGEAATPAPGAQDADKAAQAFAAMQRNWTM